MRTLTPIAALCGLALAVAPTGTGAQQSPLPAALPLAGLGPDRSITAANCTVEAVGTSISPSEIGEPVRAVTLAAPVWVAATGATPAHCRIDGSMAPAEPVPTARAINFRVLLPAAWSHRAAHLGGGGMNGVIPNLTGNTGTGAADSPLARGFVTFGSDSGHQGGGFGRRGGGPPPDVAWTLNDEAIRNLGYLQMKKTRDAAMAIVQRVYGERPRYTYYIGTSQGGREALTVAQRYPADYDGIIANVPIVGFSSLMLAPELIRIHEKPLANWVTPAKTRAIADEFMRQCDALDGLVDGVINHYQACRAVFDVTEGAPGRQPWAAKRCPNGVDPNPQDTSPRACVTDGQISTLHLVYSRYRYATPLANGDQTFGMWVPNTDPAGSEGITSTRYRGQEGAPPDAPMHAHLGVLGVTGFLMRNPAANPLDYVEGGPLNPRRVELSGWLDSTDPDLSAFERRGGKLIVTIGTNDTLASPGEQLDYYQALVDRMGAAALQSFARLFVMPQAGHGLSGRAHVVNGRGEPTAEAPIPNSFDRLALLLDWVERNQGPALSVTVSAGDRSLPLCSYPMYPHYTSGPASSASSYRCQ